MALKPRTRGGGRRAIRRTHHFADPAVGLLDRRGDVALPAVAGEKHIGDHLQTIANQPGDGFGEQRAICLFTFSPLFVEANEVVADIGLRELVV